MSVQSTSGNNHIHFPLSRPSTPQTARSPQTLRRKKRITLPRFKSSSSLRRRFLNLSDEYCRPASPASMRIGTPSRPYYTAIRKNMSRPNSPSPLPSRSPSPSPLQTSTPCIMPRLMSLVSTPTSKEHLPLASIPQFQSPHRGFSLSGETELRMSLPDYRFREMGNRTSGSVGRKVRKLGREIKDLMTRAT
jgi:hypothetical protein